MDPASSSFIADPTLDLLNIADVGWMTSNTIVAARLWDRIKLYYKQKQGSSESQEELASIFTEFLRVCCLLPSMKWIPRRITRRDLDEGLKIVREEAIRRDLKRALQEKKCEICRAKFEVESCDARALECGHRYHERCIVEWLCGRSCCPACQWEVPLPKSLEETVARASSLFPLLN